MSRFDRVHSRNIEKKKEAQDRQAEYDKLTPQQKLAMLDRRFGPGLGAARQRAKLAKKL